jgi:hypothetical protein
MSLPGSTNCTLCALGSTTDRWTACKDCEPGTTHVVQTASFCRSCTAGKYTNMTANGGDCLNCPIGTYQSDSGKSSCDVCPEGEYQPSEGQSRCKPCSAHQIRVNNLNASMFVNNADSCYDCPEGTFSDGSSTACVNCSAGTYQETVVTGNQCASCFGNTIANQEGTSQCAACPAGSVSENFLRCVLCTSGKYHADVADSECTDCAVGFFSNPGALHCGACNPRPSRAR